METWSEDLWKKIPHRSAEYQLAALADAGFG